MMSPDEARSVRDAFLVITRRERPLLIPTNWEGKDPEPSRLEPDGWIFCYSEFSQRSNYEALVVHDATRTAYVVLGAIGNGFLLAKNNPQVRIAALTEGWSRLGWPRSCERWLGSGLGRYQLFAGGLVIWEGSPDLAYPRTVEEEFSRGRRCFGIVAFADLRGSTAWAAKESPEAIQETIAHLEEEVQDAFAVEWCRPLFVKGVGDGVMIVSESSRYEPPVQTPLRLDAPTETALRPGHAADFVRACVRVVRRASAWLPQPLAIGFGIDCGGLNQVFAYGRHDYLAPAANNASKIQALASNGICVSATFFEALRRDLLPGDPFLESAVPIPPLVFRLDPAHL